MSKNIRTFKNAWKKFQLFDCWKNPELLLTLHFNHQLLLTEPNCGLTEPLTLPLVDLTTWLIWYFQQKFVIKLISQQKVVICFIERITENVFNEIGKFILYWHIFLFKNGYANETFLKKDTLKEVFLKFLQKQLVVLFSVNPPKRTCDYINR